MAETKRTTAVIVGAGISGLSAAKLLKEQGIDCIVLEAQDRVGGRTYTTQNSKCKYVDLGGAYVGPTQNRILRLAKELGVETYKVYEEKPLIFYREGKRKTFQGVAEVPFTNPIALLDFNNATRLIDKFGAEIPLEAPWQAARAKEWDDMSFADFLNQYTWTQIVKDTLAVFISGLLCVEPHEVSFLWCLWYIKSGHGMRRIFSTTDGGQERKFIGGAQQISQKMAEQLGDKVLLQHPVIQIDQTGSEVKVSTLNGKLILADYVVMAIPPALQMKITFSPGLPHLRNQIIQRMPMGCIIKTNIYYSRAFWRERGYCGTVVMLGKDQPIEYAMDDTKPDGTIPSLIGFVLSNKARYFATMTKEERCREIAECYARAFATKEALNYTHYEEKSWSEDAWSGGCYAGYMPPGQLTQYGPVLRKPVGRVYFAGTETASRWMGYMDGAIQAGERAAREVMFALGKIRKDEIWQEDLSVDEIPVRPLEPDFLERHLPSVTGLLKSVCATAVSFCVLGTAITFGVFVK